MSLDWVLIVFNSIAGISLTLIISNDNFPVINHGGVIKIALWLGALGLIIQALRTFYNVHLGGFPFNDLPIWMLKDFSLGLLAVGLFVTLYKNKKDKK